MGEIRSGATASDEVGCAAAGAGPQRSSLIGGIRYYDTVVDDARHTMMVARTAAHYGAVVRTSTQVVSLLREGDRVVGVAIRDSEDGAVTEVHGHVVINATGVWTDEIQALSRERGRFRVRASRGAHRGAPGPDRQRGRHHPAHREVGAVRDPVGHALDHRHHRYRLEPGPGPPAATKVDIDYILNTVNTVLATPLTHDDIDGVYAGLRPLLAGESEETSKLSREHAVAVPRRAWWRSRAASTPPTG